MAILYSLSKVTYNGQAQVLVRVRFGRNTDLFAKTGIFVPVELWNAKERRCNIPRRYEDENVILARKAQLQLEALTEHIYRSYTAECSKNLSSQWLQRIINHDVDERPIIDTIDEYCEVKQVAIRTRYKFHALRKHIERYEQVTRTHMYANQLTIYDIDSFIKFHR